jgi:hypothetical protein
METTTLNLTTAAEILEAYLQNFDAYPSRKKEATRIPSDEFHRLIRTKPIHESVTACLGKGQFDLAVVFLDAAYYRNNPGSAEDRELARLGMELAEAGLKEKKLNFVEWGLNRAYEIYPAGSPERRQVIERGVSLVDDFTGKGGSLFFAEVILTRSLEIYPAGTDEHRQASEKQEAIAKQRQASYALGSRHNSPRSLAKPPVPRKTLGDLAVVG